MFKNLGQNEFLKDWINIGELPALKNTQEQDATDPISELTIDFFFFPKRLNNKSTEMSCSHKHSLAIQHFQQGTS